VYILGISCFYHDSAAALLQDGMLIAAAEEERFSRKKHDYGFPTQAIDFCLRKAGIAPGDLDYVVFYEKPLLKFRRILVTTLSTFPKSSRSFREAMIAWFGEKLWIKSLISEKLDLPASKIHFVEHHLCHAASAFFCSPFEKTAIMTVDGVGEWTTATLGVANALWNDRGENNIKLFKEIKFPHSLGLLYSAFTAFLGFKVNNGEYKVMGMAPYGQPRYIDKVLKLIEIKGDGSFFLNMDYFSYHYSPDRTFTTKFEELFGPPRNPRMEFFTKLTGPSLQGKETELERNQYYADVAASIQWVTEEVLLKMANYIHVETGLDKLCLAGGVSLNSVANGRILRETPFEELYIQPAAGDSGGAVGAALYAYHILLQRPRRFVMEHSYWGEDYGEAELKRFLDESGITYERVKDDEKLLDMLVDDLVTGKVVGWLQGRFEWGPRALGNRSILADPRRADMKDTVNSRIKFREPFRPFAPSVLEERTEEFFELPEAVKHYPARFMLMVVPVKEDKRDVISAVTHVGGTARLQTVKRELNPRYHRLIEKFGEATGVPVLLNTSFNLKGEPIVNMPQEAFNTFFGSGMDTLGLGNFLIRKQK
jgi:carbamoyltransferase